MANSPNYRAGTNSRQLKLHLGVVVMPYRLRGMTTEGVAKILESKYGVMGAYHRVHGKDMIEAMVKSLEGSLGALLMGKAVDPWGRGMQSIEHGFRDFINSKEAERVGIPNTPTAAALLGVNHRRKHPYSRSNPRRPSFRDTGLYVTSFRSWIT